MFILFRGSNLVQIIFEAKIILMILTCLSYEKKFLAKKIFKFEFRIETWIQISKVKFI